MTVSVIIPAYNSAGYIARAVKSVINQTRPPEEIIVVDDGSTDDTAEIVSEFGGRVQYTYQDNAGASAARNTGILEARGEWIAFLDADDEFLPGHLELQLGLLERNPQLAWTTGNFIRCNCTTENRYEDITPSRMKKIREILGGREYFDSYFRAHVAFAAGCTDTIVVKRQALIDAGLFTVGMKRINDVDMWFRVAYQNRAIGFCPEPLAIYHLDVPDSIIKAHTDPEFVCEFIDRHQQLAGEHGCLDEFNLSAAKMVSWWITCLLDENRGADTRKLLDKYSSLFTGKFRITNRIKSYFPRLGKWYDRMKG